MNDTPKKSLKENSSNSKPTMTGKHGEKSATPVAHGNFTTNNSLRNHLNGIGLEHWLEHLKYHRGAMEVRRSIQIKVFTGCVVLLLLMGKTGYDILIGPGGTEQIRLLLQLGAFAVPVFLLFFLLQIERTNKEARENYTYLSMRLNAHFKNETIPPDNIEKEGFFTAMSRSWAATWPFLATLGLSIFVFMGFKFAPLNVKANLQKKQNTVTQSLSERSDTSAKDVDKKTKS